MPFNRLFALTALVMLFSGCGVFTGRIDSGDVKSVELNSIERSGPEPTVPISSNTESVTSYYSFPGQNSLIGTDGDLDVAIVGRGFFMVEMDGEIALTRSGNLSRNGEGNLIVGPPENSLLLLPECHLPADATDVSISADGRVSMLFDGVIQEVCQLQLYRVPDRNRVREVRRNLYVETTESGTAQPWIPGSAGFGSISHRVLESDVQVALFPEHNTLNRRPRAGERRFPLPATVAIENSESAAPAFSDTESVTSYSAFPGQNSLIETDRGLDVAIVGRGFFRVEMNGEIALTRSGNLSRNGEGNLIVGPPENSLLLLPECHVPADATDVSISADGLVNAQVGGVVQQVCQLQLHRVPYSHQLLEVRRNLYIETKESGTAQPGIPGSAGLGSLRHRVLEEDVQVPLFPEYSALSRRPREGERRSPCPSTVAIDNSETAVHTLSDAVPASSDAESVTGYSALSGQNSLVGTDGDLDVAIVGRGFFMVEMDGEIALTRSGNLSRNGEGNLIVGAPENSLLLLPECHLPADATDVAISADGRVSILLDGVVQEACQLQLYRVPDCHQLMEVRRNLYIQTKESGAAQPGIPGIAGLGAIRHRVLEPDVQVSLFPEYNMLKRKPRAGERRFPVPSAVTIENSEPIQTVPTSSPTDSVTSYSAFAPQNSLADSNGDLDVAIVGRGFFMVQMNGEIALTRSGNFSRNGEGHLIVGPPENSLLLLPVCHIPAGATAVSISSDGRVSMLLDGVIQEVCQLQLYRVPNRHQLLEVRRNLYIPTRESGAAQLGIPGTDGRGSLRHRVLEADAQVSLFPEYNTLKRRLRVGVRRFPLPSTVN